MTDSTEKFFLSKAGIVLESLGVECGHEICMEQALSEIPLNSIQTMLFVSGLESSLNMKVDFKKIQSIGKLSIGDLYKAILGE